MQETTVHSDGGFLHFVILCTLFFLRKYPFALYLIADEEKTDVNRKFNKRGDYRHGVGEQPVYQRHKPRRYEHLRDAQAVIPQQRALIALVVVKHHGIVSVEVCKRRESARNGGGKKLCIFSRSCAEKAAPVAVLYNCDR